ncbi:hypothetical protein K458DRAFT_423579 [Lentithecium fluviatile CBS 122367]|uniref:Uncharacterized protein n=1 Tax=Lentithecium fluviatile CBS 122367 TaxID=1168545 RepID=A0A6G1IIT1_9PLEO|nr:hypothetical protein K458DRAFT_423579 [Lentithecium fluviatile CBS 122367]
MAPLTFNCLSSLYLMRTLSPGSVAFASSLRHLKERDLSTLGSAKACLGPVPEQTSVYALPYKKRYCQQTLSKYCTSALARRRFKRQLKYPTLQRA